MMLPKAPYHVKTHKHTRTHTHTHTHIGTTRLILSSVSPNCGGHSRPGAPTVGAGLISTAHFLPWATPFYSSSVTPVSIQKIAHFLFSALKNTQLKTCHNLVGLKTGSESLQLPPFQYHNISHRLSTSRPLKKNHDRNTVWHIFASNTQGVM